MNAHLLPVTKATAFASLLLVCAPAVSIGAELKNETLRAWEDYIQTVNSRMEERLHGGLPFLWVDGAPQGRRSLMEGGSIHVVVGETW